MMFLASSSISALKTNLSFSAIARAAAGLAEISSTRRFTLENFANVSGLHKSSSFPDVQLHIVDAPLGAGPESILPIVVMDSGLATWSRPGMTASWWVRHMRYQ